MNGEIQVLNNAAVLFPIKTENNSYNQTIVEENKIEVSTVEVETPKKKDRFGRLKKHLRKRSASIL
jgi:hypothetical protein